MEENRLTRLPVELFGLTNLVVLNASNNKLTSIPAEVGTLKQLTRLWLSGNSLGALPDSIGELARLSEFTIQGNMMTELPLAVGQLGRQVKLRLSADDHVCSDNRLPILWPHIDVVSAPSGRTEKHIKMLKRRAAKLMKQAEEEARAVAAATPDDRNLDDLLADIMGDGTGARPGKPTSQKATPKQRKGEMSDLERYLSSIGGEPAPAPEPAPEPMADSAAGDDTSTAAEPGPKKTSTKKKRNRKKGKSGPGKAAAELRFKIGDKVQANVGTFTDGEVIAIWDEGNPYRVKLDDGKETEVWAPQDNDMFIRTRRN